MRILLLLISFIFCCNFYAQKRVLNDVVFKGNKKTKTSFLKKITETKAGNRLDSIELNNDLNLLKRLPVVSHAYYKVKQLNETSYAVSFFIEENFTLIPDVAFWTAINNRFSYRLGVTEYNLFGRNIGVGGFYQDNGYDTYTLSFRAPNLFSKKWGLAVNHQNWKSEEPLFLNNGSANYLYNNISTEVLGIYQANFHHQFTFGISLFEEDYEYLSGQIDPDVPQDLNLNKTLYKLLYAYNDIDYHFQYLDGFKSELIVQYVTTVNDFQEQFFIAWNDFFYYDRVGEKGNWANRLRLGIATNNDSPFAPFAVDNNVNLRGVGVLVDRGTAAIVYNTEYRHTLYDKKWLTIQGNVFFDGGTWRTPGGDLNDFTQKENIELFSGVGLRFLTKKVYNAVFRIDYGHSLKDDRNGIVFGIGQYF